MKRHIAEYVSPGHPDRLADAIVESIVERAVSLDAEALVGIECAVHTDHVFIDGRIACGHGICSLVHDDIERLVREVYAAAGYGSRWIPSPDALKVIQNVCLEALEDDERNARALSDDQNVVTGYACNHPETDYLPPAHFIANFIGRAVDAFRRTKPAAFGPDFKVLVSLSFDGARAYSWQRLTISIQHAPGVYPEEQHALIRPVVDQALRELETRGLPGISVLPTERFVLNGAGDFIQGGPEGDNGLSGKKLAIDFYGPEIPIGGGAICGKDPHKVDVAGAFRARELAKRLLLARGGESVTVRLGWTPGEATPSFREAETSDSLGLVRNIPESALPSEDWFSIKAIVADGKLTTFPRRSSLLRGYFFNG